MLTHRDVRVEDTGKTCPAEPDADSGESRALRPLQAAVITYRIAFAFRAGQKMLTLPWRGAARRTAPQPLCADIASFSLHCAVWVEAPDCKRLEQSCRDFTRPALPDEPVQLNAAGLASRGRTSLANPHPSSPTHRHEPHGPTAGGVGLRAETARRRRHLGQPADSNPCSAVLTALERWYIAAIEAPSPSTAARGEPVQ